MKYNVLVFPCGSEIGLEIYRSLAFSTHVNLFGGSSVEDHGQFVYKSYIGNIPSVDSANFIGQLNKIIKKHRIDFIFPAHDSVVTRLSQESAAGHLACSVITSPADTCRLARSKKKTYEFLDDVVKTPRVYRPDEIRRSDFPIFLKPDTGQGTKGTYLAKDLKQLEFYVRENPSLLALEYLPGKEYTVDCFTDRNGKLIFCEGRERVRILNGISVNTITVNDRRFKEIAAKISRRVEFRGAWFFQVKENVNKEPVLLEIAPRIAGTMALPRAKGVNLPLLSLLDALGQAVSINENGYEIELDRALENRYRHNIRYSHVYLDFDDLVIIDGKINPQAMAFVFQCMNKGVKIHLLTRHRQDLKKSLEQYKLNGLFDELLWVKQGEEKVDYIKEPQSIFIDDSFSERQKVQEIKKIPVFDAHMVESLLEKER